MNTILKTLLLSTLLISSCQNKQEVLFEENDIEIKLTNINTKKNEKTGNTIIQLNVLITNNSNIEISSVKYQLEVYDKQGRLLKTYNKTYYGEDKSLKIKESVEDYFGFQDKFEEDVDSFNFKIIETKSVDELPLVHLPQEGEYLYILMGMKDIKENLPKRIYVSIDHMGAQEIADVKDKKTIEKMVAEFCKIKILKETNVFVTDNYNYIGFEFDENKSFGINLNLYNLELHTYAKTHLYELSDLEGFWNISKELAIYKN